MLRLPTVFISRWMYVGIKIVHDLWSMCTCPSPLSTYPISTSSVVVRPKKSVKASEICVPRCVSFTLILFLQRGVHSCPCAPDLLCLKAFALFSEALPIASPIFAKSLYSANEQRHCTAGAVLTPLWKRSHLRVPFNSGGGGSAITNTSRSIAYSLASS